MRWNRTPAACGKSGTRAPGRSSAIRCAAPGWRRGTGARGYWQRTPFRPTSAARPITNLYPALSRCGVLFLAKALPGPPEPRRHLTPAGLLARNEDGQRKDLSGHAPGEHYSHDQDREGEQNFDCACFAQQEPHRHGRDARKRDVTECPVEEAVRVPDKTQIGRASCRAAGAEQVGRV